MATRLDDGEVPTLAMARNISAVLIWVFPVMKWGRPDAAIVKAYI